MISKDGQKFNIVFSSLKPNREVERMALTGEEAATDPVSAWESLLRDGVTMLGKTAERRRKWGTSAEGVGCRNP